MKIILVLIYLYGIITVGRQYIYLLTKRVPLWSDTMKPEKITYVEAIISMIFWPVLWIGRAIDFHLDQPYLKN